MQRGDAEAVALQRLVEHLHVALAVAEDDRVLEVLRPAQDAPQGSRFEWGSRPAAMRRCVIVEAVVAWRATSMRAGLWRNVSVSRWISGAHRRGEEQGLAGERHEAADALDVGDETHVEHAVRLVDDEDFDAS